MSDLVVDTSVGHWQAVGALRAQLSKKGLAISTPDAHVAQCALDACAALWSGDAIFRKVARASGLRVFES